MIYSLEHEKLSICLGKRKKLRRIFTTVKKKWSNYLLKVKSTTLLSKQLFAAHTRLSTLKSGEQLNSEHAACLSQIGPKQRKERLRLPMHGKNLCECCFQKVLGILTLSRYFCNERGYLGDIL